MGEKTCFQNPVETCESEDPLELTKLNKCINSEADMVKWESSPAYNNIFSVLQLLNNSVQSKPRSTPHPKSPIVVALLNSLGKVREILNSVEPLQQPMRYGNRAFRTFLSTVNEKRAEILKDVTDNWEAHDYFVQSFGSWTRIDFGTGHELNFLAFITSLAVLNLITPEDGPAIVFDVFWEYWNLHTEVKAKYHQEPAGSHGAWSIDDYVFLPFLFGSSQLINHPDITPANVIDPNVAKNNRDEYAYCRWIDYIYHEKFGAFAEHSRMLYSLRNLPHFVKLNGGMIKMYQGEVMDRFLVELQEIPKAKGFYSSKEALKCEHKAVQPVSLKRNDYKIIKGPVTSDKASRKLEDENTMTFYVDIRAKKPEIAAAINRLYHVKPVSVKTLITPKFLKKAYVRLPEEVEAMNLANEMA
ncbi:serine/threonine-protein phosphatase 2A activator-like [Histomonas meleagridis]|nr:serine/threonine-protein phosphatase 2A activator-like [Histomonas meleagridis]